MIEDDLIFFFNDTATTEIYTLSLHDALPISIRLAAAGSVSRRQMASAMAAGSSGGTRMPVSPSRTASDTPPESPATTGSPHAEASTSEIPNPSTPSRSARREAPTYTDARL